MCLTLATATAVTGHPTISDPTRRPYTRTFHHARQLSPGDWWRPDPDRYPHVVTEIHRTRTWDRRTLTGTSTVIERVTLTDQYGSTFTYPAEEVLPTAVPDPMFITTPRAGTR